MKQAYVSLVIVNQFEKPTSEVIEKIDKVLSKVTRKHEIILVTRNTKDHFGLNSVKLNGPLTVVSVQSSANKDDLMIAGLGRSVGDFVLEWSLEPSKLDGVTISSLLTPSDSGSELIEGLPERSSRITCFFYTLVNKLRPSNHPVTQSLARVYSRRALNWVLEANRYETNLMVLVAELPFQKSTQVFPMTGSTPRGLMERAQEGITLLIKGSRFGTVVPLFLSGISSLFALGVAVYAVLVFLLSGNVAEGWTSIAVVIGLGQGAILALIGLVWTRLDSLAKGLSKRNDATVNVEVFPANM